jgi:hypothetical protein
MKIQVFAHCLLSEIGKIPVQKQSRRIGVGPVGWNSPGFRRGRQPCRGCVEPDRRPLFLPLEVSGILCGVNDLVLLVDQPVELLNVRIKSFRLQFAELLPVIRTVEAPQLGQSTFTAAPIWRWQRAPRWWLIGRSEDRTC